MNETQIMEALRAAAEQGGLSQKEIAEKIGAKQPNVSLYLTGKRLPELGTLVRLAAAVGLEVELRPVRRGRGRPAKRT